MLKRLFGVEINLFWERQIPHSGQGNGGFEGNEHYGMSVCASNLALYGLQVKYFGVAMCRKTRVKKTKSRKPKRNSRYRRRISTTSLRILYAFLILVGALILAGIALFLRIETPSAWKFLSNIGSWLVLIYIVGRNLR